MVEQQPVATFGGEDIKQEEPSSQTLSANDEEEMVLAAVTEEKVFKETEKDQPEIIHETSIKYI